jgi:hypothetical protein
MVYTCRQCGRHHPAPQEFQDAWTAHYAEHGNTNDFEWPCPDAE